MLSVALGAVLGVMLTALFAGGCQSTKAEEKITITAAELPNASILPTGQWQNVPWSGAPWTRYPAASTLTLEHGLGRQPANVSVYIAFDDTGASSALSAGDITQIREVTDTVVTLHNATQEDFFIRVVLY